MRDDPPIFHDADGQALNGAYSTSHDNGERASLTYYKNGYRDGLHKQFYDNGNIKGVGHYKNGKKHGHFKEWHLNGKVMFDAEYREDKAISPLKQWHNDQDHTPQSVTNVFDGQKHALSVLFNTSGFPIKVTLYDHGREVDCQTHIRNIERLLKSDEAKRLEEQLDENGVHFTLP